MRTFRVHVRAMQGRISPYMYPILQLHTACLHAFFFSWSPLPCIREMRKSGLQIFFRSGQAQTREDALHSLARL